MLCVLCDDVEHYSLLLVYVRLLELVFVGYCDVCALRPVPVCLWFVADYYIQGRNEVILLFLTLQMDYVMKVLLGMNGEEKLCYIVWTIRFVVVVLVWI